MRQSLKTLTIFWRFGQILRTFRRALSVSWLQPLLLKGPSKVRAFLRDSGVGDSTFLIGLAAELIRAMWDVTRSCFVRLNGPQRTRMIKRAIRRRSGCVLRLDAALLTKLLYGDDTTQADCDELLRRLRETPIGESASLDFSRGLLSLESQLVVATVFHLLCRHFRRQHGASCRLRQRGRVGGPPGDGREVPCEGLSDCQTVFSFEAKSRS